MAEHPAGKTAISISEGVYLLYFLTLFGGKAFGLADGMAIYPAILLLGMVLFVLKVLLTEQSLFEYLWMALLLGLALLVYRNTGEKGLLLYFTMMLGIKGVEIRRVLKTGLLIGITGYAILSFLSVFGIIEDRMFPQSKAVIGFMLRRELGYPGMNVAHSAFFVLVVIVLLLCAEQKEVQWGRLTIGLLACNLFAFIYTGSFTGVISTTVLLLVNLYYSKRGRITGADHLWMAALAVVMILYTFVLPLLIKGDLFWKLDDIFNNRFEYPLYFFTHERVTLFGSRFGPTLSSDYYLDNAFQYAFLQLGLIPFIVLLCLLILLIRDCIINDRRTLLSAIIAYCVLGMSDPLLFNLGYKNLLFLFIGSYLYRRSAYMEARLPALCRKTIHILKRGRKQISLPAYSVTELLTETWKTHKKKMICITAIIAIAVGFYTLIAGSAATQGIFRDMAFMEEIRTSEKLSAFAETPSAGWYLVYVRNALLCGIYAGMIAALCLTCYTCRSNKMGKTQ